MKSRKILLPTYTWFSRGRSHLSVILTHCDPYLGLFFFVYKEISMTSLFGVMDILQNFITLDHSLIIHESEALVKCLSCAKTPEVS